MIVVAQDQSVFSKKAAQIVAETASEAIAARGKFVLALCGGRAPQPVLSLLAENYYRDRIDWKNVVVCWGDERCVPPDNSESNYKLALDCLLSKVPVPVANIHRISGEMLSAQDAAKAYEQDLKMLFRFERPFPKFDLVMLGVGEDGHTASLFPGSSALDETEKWVVGHRVEKLGMNRITLTYPVINNARKILVLCPGENKATVARDVFWDEAPKSRYPVQRVTPVAGEIIWLLDRGSASKLVASAQSQASYI